MADVKTFPRARGWGLCSGIEQIWEEHVLDGEATLRYSLLMMIAQDHIDGRAVALDAIGPPVVTQKRAILVDQVAEPGQHDAHVVERQSLHILLLHAVLGSAEGAVDRLHEIRMLVALAAFRALRNTSPSVDCVVEIDKVAGEHINRRRNVRL